MAVISDLSACLTLHHWAAAKQRLIYLNVVCLLLDNQTYLAAIVTAAARSIARAVMLVSVA